MKRLFVVALFSSACVLAAVAPAASSGASHRLTRPSPPTSVVALGYHGGINVQWGPPTSDGGSPVLYYVVSFTYSGAVQCVVPASVYQCSDYVPFREPPFDMVFPVRVKAVSVIGASTPVVTSADEPH